MNDDNIPPNIDWSEEETAPVQEVVFKPPTLILDDDSSNTVPSIAPKSALISIAFASSVATSRYGISKELEWIAFSGTEHREIAQKDSIGLFSPVSLLPGQTARRESSVDTVNALVLDIDEGERWADVLSRLNAYTYWAYTTFSHSDTENKFRIVLPLAQPVKASQWRTAWASGVQRLGIKVDTTCQDPARLYYLPSCRLGGTHLSQLNEGQFLHLSDQVSENHTKSPANKSSRRSEFQTDPLNSLSSRQLYRWAKANGASPKKQYGGEGIIWVNCPWRSSHTDGKQGPKDSYLLDKCDGGLPIFLCSHAHCREIRNFRSLLKIWGSPESLDAEVGNKKKIITPFSEIEQSAVPWLWPGWLVEGGFHILAGESSTGKTTLALSLAAIISTGSKWPDGSVCERVGGVLIWSSEDDPNYTLAPRLTAAGADLSRCQFVGGLDESHEPFDPIQDMGRLEDEIEQIQGVKLLIIDPIVLFVQGEGNSNPQVRRSLAPLVSLGQRHKCAILGISHFNKGSKDNAPIDRVNGSLGYVAQSRVSLGTVRRKNAAPGEFPCRLVRLKGNLAPDSDRGGFEYGQEEVEIPTPAKRASRTCWGPAIIGTAEETLREAESPKCDQFSSVTKEATAWLKERLSSGEMKRSEIQEQGKEEGYSEKILRTARENLKCIIRYEGRRADRISYWSLPITFPPIISL